MATALELVKRGSALLDERRPGWVDEVDISQLNIALGAKCILGQIYGGYGDGLGILGILSKGPDYGFCRAVASLGSSSDELTAAWRDEIAGRRLANVPKPVAA